MKKFFFSLLFLLSLFSFSDSLRVANFNAKRLGEDKKNYKVTAKIVSKFDVIGIEEVIEEKGLKLLLDELKKINNNYDYIISDIPVGTKKYKEYYAVIYDKTKVDSIQNVGFYPVKEFIRPPHAFKITSNSFDFIVVLAHSIYGDDIVERVKEASRYYKVYNYFKKLTNEEDIILMGDFNLPATNKAFDSLRELGLVPIFDANKFSTTLSTKGLANSYDNIWMKLDDVKEFNLTYGVYNFAHKKDYNAIRNYISDHIIVFVDFDTNKDLDK